MSRADNIASTLLELGRIQGDGGRRSADIRAQGQASAGQMWGQTIASLGQIPGQVIQQRQQDADQAQTRQIRSQQLQMGQMQLTSAQRQQAAEDALNGAYKNALQPDGSVDMGKLAQAIANTPAASHWPAIQKGFMDSQEQTLKASEMRSKVEAAERDHIASIGFAADAAPDPETKAAILLVNVASGIKRGAISEEQGRPLIQQLIGQSGAPDPAAVQNVLGQMKGMASAEDVQKRATAAKTTADTEHQRAVNAGMQGGMTANEIADNARQLAAQQAAAAAQSTNQRIAQQNADANTTRANRPPVATGSSATALSDVKEAVAGMKDGTVPPILPGRATKEYLATLAEAHRQGYDVAAAATDWAATQKHVATMNGAQQLRLNQSVNALPELLDSVDALADKWKGGRFPVLNRANLALAKGGAYGKDAASIANQLESQIADVTADLGNVYMGGNSPTDHALELAGKSLKSDWDAKVLKDMIALARKNVTIRQNSIKNTGVAGASDSNPYAPKTVTPGAKPDPLGIR